MSSLGTLSTGQTARIGGLPFTSVSTSNSQAAINVGYVSNMSIGAVNALTGYIGASANYVNLQKFSTTSGTAPLTVGEVSATGEVVFKGWYVV